MVYPDSWQHPGASHGQRGMGGHHFLHNLAGPGAVARVEMKSRLLNDYPSSTTTSKSTPLPDLADGMAR